MSNTDENVRKVYQQICDNVAAEMWQMLEGDGLDVDYTAAPGRRVRYSDESNDATRR